MSAPENKAVAHRFVEEVLNRGDWGALYELTAPNCVDHSAADGFATLAHLMVHWRNAFPDLQFTPRATVAEGDLVAIRLDVRGTHRGEFIGLAPTGRAMQTMGITVERVVGDIIVEHWGCFDTLDLVRQLGGGAQPGSAAEDTRPPTPGGSRPPEDGASQAPSTGVHPDALADHSPAEPA